MTLEEVERWFAYRDNRNDTAHDYGEGFANETLRHGPDPPPVANIKEPCRKRGVLWIRSGNRISAQRVRTE